MLILPVRQHAYPVDTPQDFSYTSLDQTYSTHSRPVCVRWAQALGGGKLRCALLSVMEGGAGPLHAGLSSRRSWVAQALGWLSMYMPPVPPDRPSDRYPSIRSLLSIKLLSLLKSLSAFV